MQILCLYSYEITYLPLSLPSLQIFNVHPATRVDIIALPDQHVVGRPHIGNRRFSWVLSRHPYVQRYIVCRCAVLDWYRSSQEQE
jgi:hypothetical protein